MCRLYGFRATEPTKVECTLVYAQNALLRQSRADRRGVSHPDGWGIACYENHVPGVEKRSSAAYEDLHFSVTAERVYARTVVGHVRQATVGGASQGNTHPFTHGVWTFAHNGTVRAFDRVGPTLIEETDPDLRALRVGTTDSEAVFYWLMSRLRQREGGEGGGEVRPTVVADVLRGAVRTLETRCVAAGAQKPAKLNFLLTDGRFLVATRWRNDLHWVERDGIHDCEICGIPHVYHEPGASYRAVIVASEPISHEPWREVPDGSILVVTPDVAPQVTGIDGVIPAEAT